MIEQYCRPRYQIILVEPVAHLIARLTSLTPNHLTILSGITGILAAVLVAFHYPFLACAFLLFSGYLDTLDGTLARKLGSSSAKGTVLDILCDRVVEFAIIAALFFYAPLTRAVPTIFMLGSVLLCVTSFLVVGVFSENDSEKSFYYSPGLMERAEAFIFFMLMILIPSSYFFLASLFTALVFITALIRTWEFFFRPLIGVK